MRKGFLRLLPLAAAVGAFASAPVSALADSPVTNCPVLYPSGPCVGWEGTNVPTDHGGHKLNNVKIYLDYIGNWGGYGTLSNDVFNWYDGVGSSGWFSGLANVFLGGTGSATFGSQESHSSDTVNGSAGLKAEAQKVISDFGLTDSQLAQALIAVVPSPDNPGCFMNSSSCGGLAFGIHENYQTSDGTRFYVSYVVPQALVCPSGSVSTGWEWPQYKCDTGAGYEVASSHEFAEAVTDPAGDGWYGPGAYGEIGDPCLGEGTVGGPNGGLTGDVPYSTNQTFGGWTTWLSSPSDGKCRPHG